MTEIQNYATVRPGTRLLLTNDDGDELRCTLIAKNVDGWELESGDVVLCWTFRDLDKWRIYKKKINTRGKDVEFRNQQLQQLVDAVSVSEFGGISCADVDGKNWFDRREELTGKKA